MIINDFKEEVIEREKLCLIDFNFFNTHNGAISYQQKKFSFDPIIRFSITVNLFHKKAYFQGKNSQHTFDVELRMLGIQTALSVNKGIKNKNTEQIKNQVNVS